MKIPGCIITEEPALETNKKEGVKGRMGEGEMEGLSVRMRNQNEYARSRSHTRSVLVPRTDKSCNRKTVILKQKPLSFTNLHKFRENS
jgi:hypothetical protein